MSILELRHIEKSYGNRLVLKDIDLSVAHGEFLTFLGASGCGKTTLLRLISGFESPDQGKVFIQNKDVTALAPQQRNVHTVFQSYALFPHLSVFENVAFALRCRNNTNADLQARVIDALKMVKLDYLKDQQPCHLSGGQKQRVAIARAIVNKPLVLLLDEPLSALDYRLRKEMQLELKQLQRELGITFILVTHDQEEALSLSDRVVILNEAQIAQVGTPREVYETPCNLAVGHFIGEVNQFDGHVLAVNHNSLLIRSKQGDFSVEKDPLLALNKNEQVHVLIRPEDIKIWREAEKPQVSPLMFGEVIETIYKGSTVDILLKLDNGKIVKTNQFFDEDNDENLLFQIHEKIWLHWPLGWEVVLLNEYRTQI